MYLIGIDLGTSGTKTILFDTAGNIIKSAAAEYPMTQPQNGWAEQNPIDWYHAVIQTLRAVTMDIDPFCIAGIGISGQMHGLVMLDENNDVIRPSILWCDGRTAEECDEITTLIGRDRLLEITANPALAGFTASKIMWVKKHEPQNYAKCRHLLLPKDYVRFMLTGKYATDVSDASGMQLLDVKNRCWSDEVLQKLNIDKNYLPKVYESPEITGFITKQTAELTGVPEGVPVAAGAGDNAAAAIGTGVVSNNKLFTTIGTSGVVFAHTDNMVLDRKGRVHTFCCAVPGAWHVMGVTQAAGLSLKWFRDQFCKEEIAVAQAMGLDPYILLDREAENSSAGCNGLVFLPYLMAERTPHLDPDCRGVFFGLSAAHTKADLIRAVMEGVVYSLCDCFCVLNEMGIQTDKMRICGGGSRSALWRSMLSDASGITVKTLASKEGPALGAAILAGVGAGIYKSVQEGCDKTIKTDIITRPNPSTFEQYQKTYKIYKALYPQLKDIYKML